MKEKKEKFSMEKYLENFASQKQSDLKVEFLNKIISMHGFKKLKLPKSALSDAVSTIDLMSPSRSTLKENIAPPALSVTLDDVMQDLNDLAWQECCVTSIKVLNSRQAEGKENNNHKKDKKKKNNFSGVSRVSKPSQGYVPVPVPVSASTSSLHAGVEIGGKTKKTFPKRKRSARGVVNSSLP